MKCTTQISIYEIDGKKCDEFTNILTIKSHGIDSKIVIEIEGKKYTVKANELNRAIINCTGL